MLLRDPAGHEGGTVRELREALFPNGFLPMAASVQRADHWRARPIARSSARYG